MNEMKYVKKLLLICFCPLFINAANAGPACEKVNISYAENWYPLTYDVEEGVPEGIAIKIHTAVFKELDIPIVFHGSIPWKRQMLMLENGQIDAIATINFSKERAAKFSLTDSIHSFEVKAFKKKNRAIGFQKIEELSPLKGAYSRGAYYGPDFENMKKNRAILMQVNGTKHLVDLLVADRVDYLVSPVHLGKKLLKDAGQSSFIETFGPVIHVQDVHLAFSRNSKCAVLVSEYNSALKRLKAKGYFKGLYSQFSAKH